MAVRGVEGSLSHSSRQCVVQRDKVTLPVDFSALKYTTALRSTQQLTTRPLSIDSSVLLLTGQACIWNLRVLCCVVFLQEVQGSATAYSHAFNVAAGAAPREEDL